MPENDSAIRTPLFVKASEDGENLALFPQMIRFRSEHENNSSFFIFNSQFIRTFAQRSGVIRSKEDAS